MRITHILAAGLLMTGVGFSAPACAEHGYYAHDRDRGPDFERRAYDAGYRDGIRHGEDDARHRRDFRVDRDGDYRHADDGYRRDFGDRDNYRRAFRRGYETGYAEAYRRAERR